MSETKDKLFSILTKSTKIRMLRQEYEYIHGYCIALNDVIEILYQKLKESCKQETDIEREITRIMK